ncbi:AlpA family phage regulatory protein [Halomonas sp. A40-4]|nr:AlpA family phage regulatory protein [Halomonas sp. A40-4]
MLKISEVISRTGLSRSTIYNKIDCKSAGYDSTFPKQAKLGARAVAWDEVEIEHWIQGQLRARK